MILFKTIRYGNKDEGGDGKDAVFLVHAENHIEAAAVTDEYLCSYEEDKEWCSCDVVIEIGHSTHEDSNPIVIIGPSYETGIEHLSINTWRREDPDSNWELDE